MNGLIRNCPWLKVFDAAEALHAAVAADFPNRKVCCARGEMENHIKEQQGYPLSDRTSCHEW